MSKTSFFAACIGNTHLSAALWEDDTLVRHEKREVGSDFVSLLKELGKGFPTGAFCSVNPEREKVFRHALEQLDWRLPQAGRDFKVPMPLSVPRPEQIGMDRILGAYAAWKVSRSACTVVDLGTAVTLSVVGENGSFLGGAISPGSLLMARALAEGTALLPQAEVGTPSAILAKTTEKAIEAGIHYTIAGGVREWIAAVKREFGTNVRIFAAGGDLTRVGGIEEIDEIRPHLVLEGIRFAYLDASAGVLPQER